MPMKAIQFLQTNYRSGTDLVIYVHVPCNTLPSTADAPEGAGVPDSVWVSCTSPHSTQGMTTVEKATVFFGGGELKIA